MTGQHGYRVVVLKEGNVFVGQMLEHDICTQGLSMNELTERIAFLVDTESSSRNGDLSSIPAAV